MKRLFLKGYLALTKMLKSEKGDGGIILMILFTAILILAVLATQPTVISTFSDIAGKFRTFLNGKIDTLFQ